MRDTLNRTIDYLRISVTDLCDLRCRYCMPAEGVAKRDHADILSVEEIAEIAGAAASLGMQKIRITGGEPLVRRGILEICRSIAAIPGIRTLCLTTNGVRLAEMAGPLRAAGIMRLNVSLDTLRPERYARLTRGGALSRVLRGLEAAEAAGFRGTKINAVLMGGVNDDEIGAFVEWTRHADLQVRFIELMPIGACAAWDAERFLSAQAVLRAAPALERVETQGVAEVYRVPGYRGTVGLIRPMSGHFCAACNRVRLTADGRMKPCLHSGEEIPLRGLHGQALADAMAMGIAHKPAAHRLGDGGVSGAHRPMHRIGG